MPRNSSAPVPPPTETKCVDLSTGVNAVAAGAASLLSARDVNSQASDSVPCVESEPLGGLPQPNSHPRKTYYFPISQPTWATSPRKLTGLGNS